MSLIQDYAKRIIKVLIYIEDHIDEEITMNDLAKVACHSPFHFHRIFQAIVGETVHKYVRRLRVEKAAGRLCYTNDPVTEIALDASFETPSAFTRAFTQCMGKSPRNYRLLYKEVNRMNKKINNLPAIQPDAIQKLPELHLHFIRRHGNYTTSSREAWKAMVAFIHANKLDKSNMRYFSISHDDPQITSEDKLRFDACILTSQKIEETGGIGRQILKGGKYAIFTHKGPYDDLEVAIDRIFLKWLPESKDSFDGARSIFFELFNVEYAGTANEDKLITKIHIPVS